MSNVFLVCATLGCTILLLQLALSLLGLVGDHGGAELADPGDMGGMVGHDGVGGHAGSGHAGNGGEGHHVEGVAAEDGSDSNHSHHSFQLAKFITFQTVVAFLAFFGLGGLASLEAQKSPQVAILVGSLLGFGSMVILSYIVQGFRRMHQDGTVHLRRAVGRQGQVYLRIPAAGTGEGKITLVLQGRSLELKARSSGPEIKTGETIVVDDFFDGQTVIVSPLQARAEVALVESV